MGSPSLFIILILVVWIIVLAPLMFGSNKPIRRSGEGYEETRVLHEGGTAPMVERRRPKLTAADVHRHSEDADYEVVEATDADEHVLIDDAPALRSIFRRPGADEADAPAEHVDGEVIEHVEAESDAPEDADADVDTDTDTDTDTDAADAPAAGGSTKVVAEDAGGSTSVKVLAAEDADEDADAEESADRYELDESYTAPEDFGYSRIAAESATDSASESADAADGVETPTQTESADEAVVLDHDEAEAEADADAAGTEASEPGAEDASDEDIAFAKARRGRGGYDPEREKRNTATRFQRRQRTLLALIAACVVTFVIAFVAGGWTWVLPAVAVGLTAWFMIALRQVVLQERALHQRRLRQLRRARMGVALGEAAEHPRDARMRAGSVVLELDDDSPDFDTLPAARFTPEDDGDDDRFGRNGGFRRGDRYTDDELGGYGTRAS